MQIQYEIGTYKQKNCLAPHALRSNEVDVQVENKTRWHLLACITLTIITD